MYACIRIIYICTHLSLCIYIYIYIYIYYTVTSHWFEAQGFQARVARPGNRGPSRPQNDLYMYVCMYISIIYMYIYIYIHICICIHVSLSLYTYIYIYTQRERYNVYYPSRVPSSGGWAHFPRWSV